MDPIQALLQKILALGGNPAAMAEALPPGVVQTGFGTGNFAPSGAAAPFTMPQFQMPQTPQMPANMPNLPNMPNLDDIMAQVMARVQAARDRVGTMPQQREDIMARVQQAIERARGAMPNAGGAVGGDVLSALRGALSPGMPQGMPAMAMPQGMPSAPMRPQPPAMPQAPAMPQRPAMPTMPQTPVQRQPMMGAMPPLERPVPPSGFAPQAMPQPQPVAGAGTTRPVDKRLI